MTAVHGRGFGAEAQPVAEDGKAEVHAVFGVADFHTGAELSRQGNTVGVENAEGNAQAGKAGGGFGRSVYIRTGKAFAKIGHGPGLVGLRLQVAVKLRNTAGNGKIHGRALGRLDGQALQLAGLQLEQLCLNLHNICLIVLLHIAHLVINLGHGVANQRRNVQRDFSGL